MAKKLKGVIFDLDGIITDTAKYHYLAWKAIIKPFGMNLTIDINEEIKGLSRKDTLLKILEIFNYSKLDTQKIDELCFEKNELYKKLITNLSPQDILPGIEDFIKQIKEANLKMAISSSSKNAANIMELLKLKDKFDFFVNPATIINGKPHPDIYLAGVKGLNLLAEECIGLEDASVGIEGLNAGNIFSVGINAHDEYVKKFSRYYLTKTELLDLEKIYQAFSGNQTAKN
ncbi:beta-phosphoglucomutase [[Mycoplasma] testudinis]|uniref:beta-phosphoglucomutase n=1 Tax=[Mycoplasma] testudinis TaxID=33924 RepID=UPI00047F63DE|nr:beta-phosphoglucomutase [[Mycoplasma] testudinis]